MDFIKFLIQKGLLNNLVYSYIKSKTGLVREKDLTYEDLLILHHLLPEKTICAMYKEYVRGEDHYEPIIDFKITEDLKDLYRRFPEGTEILPVKIEGEKLYVASYTKEREMAAKRVQTKFTSYDVILLKCMKVSYIKKKIELSGKEDALGIEKEFTPDDKLLIICIDAIQRKATDVHIESVYDTATKDYRYPVRMRIATELEEWDRFTLTVDDNKGITNSIVKKTTTGSIADIGAKEGVSATIPDILGDGTHSARVTVSKSLGGNHAVVRLHPNDKTALDYEQLGFDARVLRDIKSLANKESGFTIIAGHVGSGKNTTSYAMIKDILSSKAIAFAEYSSPVEVRLPCVQYDYRDDTDTLIARVKNAKKEDPDMVFIGEIPSKDVAIAVRDLFDSNIGVLTTTHFDRVWHFPHKLAEFFGRGEYKDVLSQTNGIINQKMFKKLCPYCRKEVNKNNLAIEDFKILKALKVKQKFYEANLLGCDVCNKGYQVGGLKPYAEVFYLDLKVAERLISLDNPTLMEIAVKDHMINNKVSMEYFLRNDLQAGLIDLIQIKRKGVTSDIKE